MEDFQRQEATIKSETALGLRISVPALEVLHYLFIGDSDVGLCFRSVSNSNLPKTVSDANLLSLLCGLPAAGPHISNICI